MLFSRVGEKSSDQAMNHKQMGHASKLYAQ